VIVLATNVVAGLIRRDIDPVVIEWLDQQPAESIWTTAVTVLEVHAGLGILADGHRRLLEEAFGRMLEEDLEGRILPFERNTAREAADLAARPRRVGRSIETRDVQIAGIVAARRATLATRNTRHFADFGIALVDPWTRR
jgi:predicted nucleic acid-binding protein